VQDDDCVGLRVRMSFDGLRIVTWEGNGGLGFNPA
jgi:hypothetical protein